MKILTVQPPTQEISYTSNKKVWGRSKLSRPLFPRPEIAHASSKAVGTPHKLPSPRPLLNWSTRGVIEYLIDTRHDVYSIFDGKTRSLTGKKIWLVSSDASFLQDDCVSVLKENMRSQAFSGRSFIDSGKRINRKNRDIIVGDRSRVTRSLAERRKDTLLVVSSLLTFNRVRSRGHQVANRVR